MPRLRPETTPAAMTSTFALHRRATASVLGAVLCLMAGANAAYAQTRFKAHYVISMTGVSIGQIAWIGSIGDQRYTTSANGKASGVLSVLVNGEGSVDARGVIVGGRLVPKSFTSKIVDDEGNSELRMTFDDGVVKELVAPAPVPGMDRLPVTEADRRGVADPLSAMLMSAGDSAMAQENCGHVLSIFDGRRRYDLALSFKRVDKVAIAGGYSGQVLICGVVLKPIAGYRAESMLVKYVAGRRDMELWFAPVAGTSTIAPIRVSMPTLIGTLEITADQFESLAPPLPPATQVPGAPAR
jgi:Protein of unknown function (DUF3108)